jgi:GvpH
VGKSSGSLDDFFKLVQNVLTAIEKGEPAQHIKGRIGMGDIGLSYGFSLGLGLPKGAGTEFERPYPGITKDTQPSIEVIDQGKSTTILAQIPEIKEEDVAIQLKAGSITICINKEQGSRIWEIPCDPKTGVVSAQCRNGVLEIVLRRRK